MLEAQESDQIAPYARNPEDKSMTHEVVDYLLTAAVLVSLLAYLGKHAPEFSLSLIFASLLVYATPVAFSAGYRAVVEKYYSQPKFKKGSKTAKWLCGRWCGRLAVYMLLACFSAMAFAISAPSWDVAMWALMGFAAIGFYPVYRLIYRKAADHCDPVYAKMKAVQVSVLVVGVATSLLYAIIPTGSLSGLPETFFAGLEARCLCYSDSSCLLLLEIEKVTSYTDLLAEYGWSYALGSAFLAAFAVKLAFGVSVFLGIANILGFCMLDRHERLSIFRHMPEYGEIFEGQKARPGYFVCLIAVWALVSGAIWVGERVVEREAMRVGPSLVDVVLDEATDYLAMLPYLSEIKEEAALYEDYKSVVDEIKLEYGSDVDGSSIMCTATL